MNDTTPNRPNDPAESAQKRHHQRFHYHTAVTVVVDSPNGFVAVRARSNNISAGGAKIVCNQEITAQRIYLRILIPELADTFIEAELVSSCHEVVTRFGTEDDQKFTYNTRFRQFVSDGEMLDVLRVAAGVPTPA